MLTPPSPVCRTEVEAAEGCSRLPPRSAAAWRAMNAWCAAMVAATVAGPARSQDCSSSQMNTTYSAISPASQQEPKVISAPPWSRRDDLADLDVHAAGQPRATGRQRGRGVQVRGVDDHIPGQHRAARLAAARGEQGAGRADPVAHVGDRRAELPEPRPPRLLLPRRRGAVRLAAESQNVLTHTGAPFEPGRRLPPALTQYVAPHPPRSTPTAAAAHRCRAGLRRSYRSGAAPHTSKTEHHRRAATRRRQARHRMPPPLGNTAIRHPPLAARAQPRG